MGDTVKEVIEEVKPALKKVGYLESDTNRKSVSRLTIAICAGICIFATLVEGSGKILSIVKGSEAVTADWTAISFLVGALLLGTGVTKAAQRINFNPEEGNSNAA